MRDGTITLSDGRDLGVAEYGEPDGPPVIYCHGFPSCRLEPAVTEPVIDKLDQTPRLIAFDRPGYGRSTFQLGRTILDWPHDVAEAAERFGVADFAVLGVSGGCAYALACASALSDRVMRLGIIVGEGPADAPRATPAWPASNRLARWFQIASLALTFKVGLGEWVVSRSIESLAEVDRQALADPQMRKWFTDIFPEAMAQGVRPTSYEADLLRSPWGFPIESVATPTRLWYGGKDENVPAATGQWLADRLPDCVLTVWPQHGHFTWAVSDEVSDVFAWSVDSAIK